MACDCNNFTPSTPSAHSALALLQGQPGSGSMVARDILGRAAIIWLGLQASRLVRIKAPKHAEILAFFGAIAIELFVIIHVNREKVNNGN